MTDIEIDRITSDQLGDVLQALVIAEANDRFRQAGPAQDANIGRWLVSSGVDARGEAFVAQAVDAVKAFCAFTTDCDPYGTHEMGAVEIDGARLWFRIDLYDRDYRFGSENPTDPDQTRRVLTLFFPSEH